uniref:WW domain-binding protein 11-like isoform X3 n=1 Tax=Ictidomys tridecemlineatus TaxID=43179 RepID=UPI001A9EB84E|nr:WW domain-binding protein 11-like isoform X3 [Ictidomys tridecemlineatus]
MTSRKAFPLPLPAVPSSPPRNQQPPPGSGPTPPSLPLPLSSSQPGPNLVVLPRVPPPGAAFPSARSDTICQLHLDIAALSHTPGCQTPKGRLPSRRTLAVYMHHRSRRNPGQPTIMELFRGQYLIDVWTLGVPAYEDWSWQCSHDGQASYMHFNLTQPWLRSSPAAARGGPRNRGCL